uniref:Uncharacterized protein n=1 Tax=Aegilops tauschii subsp. strangulata TaxID=200361 RepID=A0A453C6A4_AEGTS
MVQEWSVWRYKATTGTGWRWSATGWTPPTSRPAFGRRWGTRTSSQWRRSFPRRSRHRHRRPPRLRGIPATTPGRQGPTPTAIRTRTPCSNLLCVCGIYRRLIHVMIPREMN